MPNENNQYITVNTTVVRSDGSSEESKQVNIVNEHFMDLVINEQLIARFDCTPTNLKELVVGRLITEKLIDSPDDIDSIDISDNGNRAEVSLKKGCDFTYKNEVLADLTSLAANKVYVRRETSDENKINKSTQKCEINKEWIFNLANAFAEETKIHKSTNGTHSCLLSVKGNVVWSVEDIGRHNAIDKTIGYALLNNYTMKDCMIFTSGRVSKDMITKVINANLPILVSKSVPTSQAIELANQNNIQLICKTWPDSFEIY